MVTGEPHTLTDGLGDPLAELNGPADLAALCVENGAYRADWIYTPIGGMVAVADSRGLHLLEFARTARLQPAFARLKGIVAGKTAVTRALQDQLVAYFAGRLDRFDLPLCLPAATPFTTRIWAAVQAVPYGATATYGRLAVATGAPGAARAVGRANGANPLAILVPCHRITGQDGALTGYAGGLWRKEWLLAHEGRGMQRP
jgi:AraC family transcriptional regulator, regulatory protein of adaptative response / methylated-DNA-[protein]-cysteine methyltransferase